MSRLRHIRALLHMFQLSRYLQPGLWARPRALRRLMKLSYLEPESLAVIFWSGHLYGCVRTSKHSNFENTKNTWEYLLNCPWISKWNMPGIWKLLVIILLALLCVIILNCIIFDKLQNKCVSIHRLMLLSTLVREAVFWSRQQCQCRLITHQIIES